MVQKYSDEVEAGTPQPKDGFAPMGSNDQADRSFAGDSPFAAENLVRRCAAAVRAGGKNVSGFRSERIAIGQWAKLRNAVLRSDTLERFKPVAEGAEHVVFHDAKFGRAIKSTHPNRYGHSVRHEFAQASPLEYLYRLALQNFFFGDDIKILGVIAQDESIQIVTSQPWISIDPKSPVPSEKEIDRFFEEKSFKRFELNEGVPMYYCALYGLLVGDAHGKNILRDSLDRLVPIDVVMGYPDPSLIEQIEGLLGRPSRYHIPLSDLDSGIFAEQNVTTEIPDSN